MMIGRCGTLAMAFACFGAAFLDTGCVAIPMGKETFTHTDTIYETASSPCRSDVVSVTPQCVQRGEVAIAKIGLEVQEEYERYSHQETVTVHKRKKLAVGILPGFASIAINPSDGILAPEMELNPNDTKDIYQSRQRWLAAEFLMPFSFGVLNGFTTFCSLFCGHFEEYETFPVTREWAGPYWDRLQRFPKSDQAKIGMFGASTETARAVKRGSSLGLVGVHKYFKLKIDPMQRSVSVPAGTSTQCKSMAAIGPYMTQFEIPALGHKNWKQVPRGDTQATFDLPKVSRDCTVEAVVTFQAAPTASGTPSDLTRQALAKVANREWRFDLVLKGTGTQPPPRQPIVPIRPQPPPKPLYEIESIEPLGDGQYVVRAKIIDKSKTFDIGRMLEPEVKRKIREDFSATHLGVPVHEIRRHLNCLGIGKRGIISQDDKIGSCLFAEFLNILTQLFFFDTVQEISVIKHSFGRIAARILHIGGKGQDDRYKDQTGNKSDPSAYEADLCIFFVSHSAPPIRIRMDAMTAITPPTAVIVAAMAIQSFLKESGATP